MVDLSKITTLTDWRIRDTDLPVLAPGEEYERVITPQKFVILLQIATLNVNLIGLRIGDVNVPFECLPSKDARTLTYRPVEPSDDLKQRLVKTGATIATRNSIAMAPGIDVRSIVRNDGAFTTKFRVAVVVQEESDE